MEGGRDMSPPKVVPVLSTQTTIGSLPVTEGAKLNPVRLRYHQRAWAITQMATSSLNNQNSENKSSNGTHSTQVYPLHNLQAGTSSNGETPSQENSLSKLEQMKQKPDSTSRSDIFKIPAIPQNTHHFVRGLQDQMQKSLQRNTTACAKVQQNHSVLIREQNLQQNMSLTKQTNSLENAQNEQQSSSYPETKSDSSKLKKKTHKNKKESEIHLCSQQQDSSQALSQDNAQDENSDQNQVQQQDLQQPQQQDLQQPQQQVYHHAEVHFQPNECQGQCSNQQHQQQNHHHQQQQQTQHFLQQNQHLHPQNHTNLSTVTASQPQQIYIGAQNHHQAVPHQEQMQRQHTQWQHPPLTAMCQQRHQHIMEQPVTFHQNNYPFQSPSFNPFNSMLPPTLPLPPQIPYPTYSTVFSPIPVQGFPSPWFYPQVLEPNIRVVPTFQMNRAPASIPLPYGQIVPQSGENHNAVQLVENNAVRTAPSTTNGTLVLQLNKSRTISLVPKSTETVSCSKRDSATMTSSKSDSATMTDSGKNSNTKGSKLKTRKPKSKLENEAETDNARSGRSPQNHAILHHPGRSASPPSTPLSSRILTNNFPELTTKDGREFICNGRALCPVLWNVGLHHPMGNDEIEDNTSSKKTRGKRRQRAPRSSARLSDSKKQKQWK